MRMLVVQLWLIALYHSGRSRRRLMRRKFGLASGPHSDFLLEISLPNLAGLDTAFAALSHADDEASRCYDRMHGMIARADVGLYRPFPDANPRERIALI